MKLLWMTRSEPIAHRQGNPLLEMPYTFARKPLCSSDGFCGSWSMDSLQNSHHWQAFVAVPQGLSFALGHERALSGSLPAIKSLTWQSSPLDDHMAEMQNRVEKASAAVAWLAMRSQTPDSRINRRLDE